MSIKIDNTRLTSEEYCNRYINNEYCKSRDPLESIIVPNFLNDAELDEFWAASQTEDVYHVTDTSMTSAIRSLCGFEQPVTAEYYIFDKFYENPCWEPLVDIMQPKLEKHLGKGVYASHIHILDSYVPYGIHSDSEQPNLQLAPEPAWTLIIPFDDVNSKTYQFHQRSAEKSPWEWVKNNNIKPFTEYSISREMWESEFAPLTDYELFRYLSVESAFEWKRGSMFAADRFRFHCSDNYYNRGIKNKRAIIMWTSTT